MLVINVLLPEINLLTGIQPLPGNVIKLRDNNLNVGNIAPNVPNGTKFHVSLFYPPDLPNGS